MDENQLKTLRAELEESRKREKELQLRADELTDFIENAAIPLHWVDGEGRIIWANRAELEALGYTKEEYLGRHINDFHAEREIIDDMLRRLKGKETLNNYAAR